MLSSVERVQDGAEVVERPAHLDQSQARYQAFVRSCATRLDHYTRGHSAEVLRVVSFLVVGGLGALVNLGCVWVFSTFTPLPHEAYIVLATEIALLFNFALNDRFTFHTQIDSRRPYWLRCLRFHGPSALGFVLTLLISSLAYHYGHLSSLLAQAAAILIVTVVNFMMHRFWTYRPPARLPQEQPAG
jgi:putative flippase GtrA